MVWRKEIIIFYLHKLVYDIFLKILKYKIKLFVHKIINVFEILIILGLPDRGLVFIQNIPVYSLISLFIYYVIKF